MLEEILLLQLENNLMNSHIDSFCENLFWYQHIGETCKWPHRFSPQRSDTFCQFWLPHPPSSPAPDSPNTFHIIDVSRAEVRPPYTMTHPLVLDLVVMCFGKSIDWGLFGVIWGIISSVVTVRLFEHFIASYAMMEPRHLDSMFFTESHKVSLPREAEDIGQWHV